MLSQNCVLVRDPLSLEHIRSILGRLEDTIIFGLIERAQYAHNAKMYVNGAISELREKGIEGSWLEWFLKEIETFHAKARRYTSLDEYPFTTGLPEPVLPPLKFPKILYPNDVNVNRSILSFYTRSIVPRITQRATIALSALKRSKGIVGEDECEDDSNYGSAATIDVEILQAISKRVHYGKFVAESKFRENPAAFIPHIRSRDRAALEALIMRRDVMAKLLMRLRKKAATYAQELGPEGDAVANSLSNSNAKVDVDGVVELYENYIIPLTIEVEVEYLIQRLNGLSETEVEGLVKTKLNGDT
ncbi:chorismate mutase [Pisolithus thermaeus]|nr:chorismate mutase [Pisolithus croceorrhizus]KAI6166610.1 chorismate mutase [Pisolithus thermaeus]